MQDERDKRIHKFNKLIKPTLTDVIITGISHLAPIFLSYHNLISQLFHFKIKRFNIKPQHNNHIH